MATMYSFANKFRPRRSVLFIRTDPEERVHISADLQEQSLREYCENKHIRVVDVVRTECDSDEAIVFLEQLAQKMPAESDSLLALRVKFYSKNLYELSRICFYYRLFGKELFSVEFHEPVRRCLTCYNNPYHEAYRKKLEQQYAKRNQKNL